MQPPLSERSNRDELLLAAILVAAVVPAAGELLPSGAQAVLSVVIFIPLLGGGIGWSLAVLRNRAVSTSTKLGAAAGAVIGVAILALDSILAL